MQTNKLKKYGFGQDLKEFYIKNIYKFKDHPNKTN